MLALLAISGASKALLLIVAGVGVFTGLSLRSWRERRKK